MKKSIPSDSIKSWAEEDRPREKLLLKGKESLSDAELIAIIIGSGSRNETAVSLSKRILNGADNNLHELGKMTLYDFMTFKGVGEAKAISIAAALEIGRRRSITDPKSKPIIQSSSDAYHAIKTQLNDVQHEEMWVMLLNQGSKLIRKIRMSSGGNNATILDIKMILKKSVEYMAQSIILVHNHPSGSLKPSRQDIAVTQKIKEAATYLDLKVADHLIISENGYFSFADQGMM